MPVTNCCVRSLIGYLIRSSPHERYSIYAVALSKGQTQ
jgi:hypothetical protein